MLLILNTFNLKVWNKLPMNGNLFKLFILELNNLWCKTEGYEIYQKLNSCSTIF